MFKVISGIFEGHEFNGQVVNINGEERVWDLDSQGRSYPLENCKKIE